MSLLLFFGFACLYFGSVVVLAVLLIGLPLVLAAPFLGAFIYIGGRILLDLMRLRTVAYQ